MGAITNVGSIEPVLFGNDQFFSADSSSDLVIENLDPARSVPQVTTVFGNSNHTMDDPGFIITANATQATEVPPILLAGHFTPGITTDELLFPFQDTVNNDIGLFVADLPFDARHRPTGALPCGSGCVQVNVDALADKNTFDMVDCGGALFATGDVSGTGIDSVVALQTLAASNCSPLAQPELLVMSTTSATDTNPPVALATTGAGASSVKLVDVNADGHLDLVITFAGTTCSGSLCTPAGNELAIVWGDASGLTTQITEVPPVPGTGVQHDAVALRIDASAVPELLVTTDIGLYAYDLQNNAYVARSAPILNYTDGSTTILGFGNTLATGDVNGDGLPDLLVDDFTGMHVLLSVPAAQTVP
jgi:hypothetical protein